MKRHATEGSQTQSHTLYGSMENKDHPNENKQKVFTQFAMVREAASIIWIWQSQRQEEEWENFIMEKKEMVSGML